MRRLRYIGADADLAGQRPGGEGREVRADAQAQLLRRIIIGDVRRLGQGGQDLEGVAGDAAGIDAQRGGDRIGPAEQRLGRLEVAGWTGDRQHAIVGGRSVR